MHMAIVIDEYGTIAGLVTLEDVLEEISQRVHDEYMIDKDSRSDWEAANKVIFDLAKQIGKDKKYDWETCCTVVHGASNGDFGGSRRSAG